MLRRNSLSKLLLIAIMMAFITSCGPKSFDLEGVILEVDDNVILLAKNLNKADYEIIKDKSVKSLRDQDLAGSIDSLGLIQLTYSKSHNLKKGDFVKVYIKGAILESYPEQAMASKILIKD